MTDEIDIDVLAESFSEFLGAEWPREKAVAFARGSEVYAADLWSQISTLGWPALTVPETYGGLGLQTPAIAALHESLGASAAPLPLLGTTLAVALVESAGNDVQKDAFLTGLADGSIRAAIGDLQGQPLIADTMTVDAVVENVLDAPAATLLLLRAQHAGKPAWIALPAHTDGVTIVPTSLADRSRSSGTVKIEQVKLDASQILSPVDGNALDDELLRLAAIAIAADALGGGNAVLNATIEYMKVREQFDRVIGSFQALKHRVADHKAALEAARGLLEQATSQTTGMNNPLLAALTAKQHITRIVAEIARDCIQLHGGVGFTSEYVPHIYLKRAKLNEALFGTRSMLLDRIADILEAA